MDCPFPENPNNNGDYICPLCGIHRKIRVRRNCKGKEACSIIEIEEISKGGHTSFWFCETHKTRKSHYFRHCFADGLGDTVEYLLNYIGITSDVWIRLKEYQVIGGQCPVLVKTPKDELTCGCEQRKAWLNKVFPYNNIRKWWSRIPKWGIIGWFTNSPPL